MAPEIGADSRSDEDLVTCFQAGDTAAFDELFQRHWMLLCQYLGCVMADYAAGEDVAQEVFIKVHRALPTLSSVRKMRYFRGWLYAVASNIVKDRWRHDHLISYISWTSAEMEMLVHPIDGPEMHVIENDFLLIILKQVQKKYRECLYLDIIVGLSQCEIANSLGITERTVRTYIREGKMAVSRVYADLMQEVL